MEHAALASLGMAIVTTLSAFVGALISHFLTQRRGLDLAIYKHRGEAYKLLWEKTSLLPKWPRRADVTYGQIHTLSEELRDWYFHVGGVYLSDPARDAYGDLQEALNDPSRSARPATLTTPDYDLLRDRCSDLRTQLTRDLLSRKRMFLVSR
jgi:hypothetical protein